MRPDFALSFSDYAVDMIYRSKDGWMRVGTAQPESDSFKDEIAYLHAQMKALNAEHEYCMLLVPNSYVRYVKKHVEKRSELLDDAARQSAAEQALIGVTPYATNELSFDHHLNASELQIAAVAKETLDEVEDFAVQLGFEPVCFSASPPATSFAPVPFFGLTQYAQSELTSLSIERERERVLVVGDLPKIPPPNAEPSKTLSASQNESLTAQKSASEARQPALPSPQTPQEKPAQPGGRSTARAPKLVATQALSAPPPATPVQSDSAGASQTRTNVKADMPAAKTGASQKPKPQIIAQAAEDLQDEEDRLTLFGARKKDNERAPKRRGVLPVLAACIALIIGLGTASVFLSPEENEDSDIVSSSAPENPMLAQEQTASQNTRPDRNIGLQEIQTPNSQTQDSQPPEQLTDADAAILDALAESGLLVDTENELGAQEQGNETAQDQDTSLDARYAVTGIWPQAPELEIANPVDGGDAITVEPAANEDANIAVAALQNPQSVETDQPFGAEAEPSSQAQEPRQNDETPDENSLAAVNVIEGPPPLRAPLRPQSIEELPPAAEIEDEAAAPQDPLAQFRPELRPEAVALRAEAERQAAQSLLERGELAAIRPQLRPAALAALPAEAVDAPPVSPVPEDDAEEQSAQEQQEQAAPEIEEINPSVARSLRPETRPANIARLIARAERAQSREAAQQTQPQSQEATPAPNRNQARSSSPRRAVAQPDGPVSASVQREATQANVLNLRRVNLLGVRGSRNNRSAVVRLGNGRTLRVGVGDRLDGGQVVAIGENELRYRKGGRDVVLRMPRG